MYRFQAKVSAEIAGAYAFKQKAQGKSLLQLQEKYSQELFKKPFEKLTDIQKNIAWKERVFSAGRPQKNATKLAKLLGSVAGGAAAGLACSTGAPVCVGLGIFVGGVMFAISSEIAFDMFWN